MDFLFDSFLSAAGLISSMDQELLVVVWTSLRVSLMALMGAAVGGIPLGLLIAMGSFPGKGAVRLLLNTLMALPTVVIGLFFYALLSRRGPLGGLELLFTPAGITLGLLVLALPLVAQLTVAAVEDSDPRLIRTCSALGANAVQSAWMLLKEERSSVASALVVAFGRVISEVGIAMMLGGNIKGFTRTMTTAIALETSKGEFVLGLALGMVLLLVAFGVNAALFALQGKR